MNIKLEKVAKRWQILISQDTSLLFLIELKRHGGTGFYVNESFQINIRIVSTFELMFPTTKTFIIACIYRHSSSISINHFTSDYIEPLLDKISTGGEMCSLLGG